MTAPRPFPVPEPVFSSQGKYGDERMKNLAETQGSGVLAARRAFADLLWVAFPSQSEHDLTVKASKVLGASQRQVKNWLRCQNSAAIHFFFVVAAIAGAEVVMCDRKGRS